MQSKMRKENFIKRTIVILVADSKDQIEGTHYLEQCKRSH